jgi:hypothetical protein
VRVLTVPLEIDLDASGLTRADAEAAIRLLLSSPIETPDGREMYYWHEPLSFNVSERA